MTEVNGIEASIASIVATQILGSSSLIMKVEPGTLGLFDRTPVDWITNPSLGDETQLNSTSDATGACISLGYQKTLSAPVMDCDPPAEIFVVKVESNGDISDGRSTYKQHGIVPCRIKKIACAGKKTKPLWAVKQLHEPTTATGQHFSPLSSLTGICKLFGHLDYPGGSDHWDSAYGQASSTTSGPNPVTFSSKKCENADIIMANENGNVVKHATTASSMHIGKLVCYKKLD